MSHRYAVIGCGRQGTAAAYDLAVHGDASAVLMADVSADAAQTAAEVVNRLVAAELARPVELDAADASAVIEFLRDVDVAVCATPFTLIPGCTRAAIEAGSGMVDLGGHTPTVLAQLELDHEAQRAGVSIVPDCGMGPGMNNTLGLYVIERLRVEGATPREVRLYDGGLPQRPANVWGYRLFFHIDGLTNEYDGEAVFLREGRVTPVPALTEPETVNFDDFGDLEAFVTSGGTSTVPYTLEGELEVYENKTLRYPGHLAGFQAFKDLGLFSQEPVEIADGLEVRPRDLLHALLEPQLDQGPAEDVCLMRAVGLGDRDGETLTVTVDLVDRYDPATGFTAMERLTGWHAAIMGGLITRGEVRAGVVKLEEAVPAGVFMEEVRRRGFVLTEGVTWGPS